VRATIVLVVTTTCAVAYADDGAGTATLARARQAWSRSDYGACETLYKQALDEGGLTTRDALDAYVHLGAARSQTGKKNAALVAFRVAALIDKTFKVPAEGGKKAATLGTLAKKQEAKFGVLVLRPEMPASAPANESFFVQVGMDPTHAAFLARVRVSVSDATAGKTVVYEQPSASQLRFAIPGSAATPDTLLAVRVFGLDPHDNQVVTAEGRVQVQSAPVKDAPLAAATPGKASPSRSPALQPTPPPPKDKSASSGGIFSSPWTYVIGGALLAGGAATLYFATRPADQVTVTNVHVQAIQ